MNLRVSPDESLLALYLDTAVLWIGNLDFSNTLVDLNLRDRVASVSGETNNPVPPSSLKWLDTATVVMQWANFIVLVDLDANVYEFFYPSCVHTETEVSLF